MHPHKGTGYINLIKSPRLGRSWTLWGTYTIVLLAGRILKLPCRYSCFFPIDWYCVSLHPESFLTAVDGR